MKDAARSHVGKIAVLVSFAFVLAFIGFSILSLIGPRFARAAEAHIARLSSATRHHSASTPFSTRVSQAPLAQDAAPDPTIINGQWYCQPPYTPQFRPISQGPGVINLDASCVEHDLSFPCSDNPAPNGRVQPNENIIRLDWLSGDIPTIMGPNAPHYAGHFTYTYPQDTYAFPAITTFFGYMQGLSFVLIIPSAILMAYNVMLGASSFRYAGSFEGLSRFLLGGLAIGVSFTLIQMLINLETTAAIAISRLHAQFPFPQTFIKGVPIPYTLPAEPSNRFPGSYRGLVVPMSRWGCAANDFIGIFSPQFITGTLAPVIPIIGDLTHLAGTVTTLPDLIHRIAEMTLTVLSILLWAQTFVRIVVLNYYILMAPLSFSCWALPGGIGQKVVTLWFKGFFSVLFVQVLQLFIITTLPLILPTLPQISSDSVGLMQSFLVEFPPILALFATLTAPTLIGVSAEKVFGTAGSMAGETITVIGTAASQAI